MDDILREIKRAKIYQKLTETWLSQSNENKMAHYYS